MDSFSNLCSILAFALGLVLLALGAVGVAKGCHASFVSPPPTGGIPALVGWGIVSSVWWSWRKRMG